MDVILFLVFAIVAVLCAINVVVQSHPISSAISLIGVMGSLAVLYLLLGAEFIAAAQVIVYAGAIMVLFVFVIMLLNAGEEERTDFSKMAKIAGWPLALALTGVLAAAMVCAGPSIPNPVDPNALAHTKDLSKLIFADFVYPFELTSFLVLVAIIGAIVLAQRQETK